MEARPGACSGATPACCPGADGRPESFSCVSLQTPEHCGACQTACQAKANTHRWLREQYLHVRVQRALAQLQRRTGTTEGPDADGCETRVDNDVNHCGACGKVCPSSLTGKNTAAIAACLRERRVPLPVRPAAVS